MSDAPISSAGRAALARAARDVRSALRQFWQGYWRDVHGC